MDAEIGRLVFDYVPNLAIISFTSQTIYKNNF